MSEHAQENDYALEEARSEDAVQLAVYLSLLALTVMTLGASLVHQGRLMTVSVALIIACAKGSLIGFYYMNLRRERALMFVILAIGALALLALLAGILPDMTFRRL